MLNEKKKIDPSISSFEKIREENNLYVDKTEYLYNLITSGTTYYFLSRPRRFGKTLTVSTLEAIFQGKKDLFKGLYISNTNYDFKEHPVIHFDFGKCQKRDAIKVEEWLNNRIIEAGVQYNVHLRDTADYDDNFSELLKKLSKKEKVVILVDEYDKLLSNNYMSKEVRELQRVLRSFFEVIKVSSDCIRFVFITGVTRYSNMSIFSSMNNLMDISTEEYYATMLGFTQKELENNFKEYIDDAVQKMHIPRDEYLKKVKDKYDGYCFFPGTETLYNSVSVSRFFVSGGVLFRNYWALTGGTKLIADMAKEVKFDEEKDIETPISESAIASRDIIEMTHRPNIVSYKALLFQAGYLTIKKAIDDDVFILGYPNNEIKEHFLTMIVNQVYLGLGEKEDIFLPKVEVQPLKTGDVNTFLESLKSIYASLPYDNNKDHQNESFYHKVFHGILKAMGVSVASEVHTNLGRIDAVVNVESHTYIFEFKLDKSADEALAQIKDRNYYKQYISPNKKKIIHLIGISFSSKERNISSYQEEII